MCLQANCNYCIFQVKKKSFGATLKMEKRVKTAQEVQTDNWKIKSYM